MQHTKYDHFVWEVEIHLSNQEYAHIKFSNGRTNIVSLRHLVFKPNFLEIYPSPSEGLFNNDQMIDLLEFG